MRWRRIALILLLAMGLAPGTWLRDDPQQRAQDMVTLVPLRVTQPDNWPAGLALEGAWDLQNANPEFGSFSAMVPHAGGFRMFGDKGRMALVPRPEFALSDEAQTQFVPHDETLSQVPDIESAVMDPKSGVLWIGYEHYNAIRRFSATGESSFVRPGAMQHWTLNSGPEAMALLADGRFVVLAERLPEGLVFAGDPLTAPEPQGFAYRAPDGFHPTAMGQLPDGRVLVLLRATSWQIPPFSIRLALADPRDLGPGAQWQLEELARFDTVEPIDNFEGLLVEDAGNGSAIIWLVSDDNHSALQRSLLLKLRFTYAADSKTAREAEASGPSGT